MPTYGMTTEGFVPKTFEIIKGELEAELRSAYGANLDLSPTSVIGVLVGLWANYLAELWEVGQAVDSGFDPDAASGQALVALCALTGTVPKAPTPSTVTLLVTGTNGTSIAAGKVAVVADTGERFEITDAGTLATATAWATATAYVAGDIRQANGNIYLCTDPGTSAGSGTGPSTNGSAITDGTVEWQYVGLGSAYAEVDAESEDNGPVAAVAGTITEIATPVAGWSGVYNALDATPGQSLESDAELRVRRENELDAISSATLDAIRSKLLDLDDVETVYIFENSTNATDGEGVPPNSFEALVLGGDDTEIAQSIWDNKPIGIGTHGDETVSITDTQGFDHDVLFSRPTERTIYATITLTYDADVYPSDGDDQIKAAIVAFGDAFTVGKDVYAAALKAQAYQVPGVLGVTTCFIDTSPAPAAETTIACTTRQLAVFDTSRVTVSSSPAAP
jgi:uncharacterized phage protein gp47/JayE